MLNVSIKSVCKEAVLLWVGDNVEVHPNLKFQVSGLNTKSKSLCVPVVIVQVMWFWRLDLDTELSRS